MVSQKSSLVEKYNSLIRDIVNDCVKPMQEVKKGTFLAKAKNRLKYDNKECWSYLCSSMDLIGDMILTIENFERFRLEGPTRYEDLGEKYLRLYGFLSSVYLLQSAVIQLCTIFKLDNIKKIKGIFQELPLIQTRHKLAAHALNYNDKEAGTKYSFVIHQFEMEDSNVSFFNNHTNQFESIDLIEELDSYLDLVIDILETLIKKLIGTVFSTSREKREEYEKELAFLKSGLWNV
jgi:hypothetical protein